MEFVDDYPTCEETSVTLRVFADDISPSEITAALQIEPSSILVKGQPRNIDRPGSIVNKTNGWFLESEENVKSKDTRRHLEWLLTQLKHSHEALQLLAERGATIDIFCPWESKTNQGGPTMAPEHMKALGELNIELQFEFWYSEEKE